MRYLAVALPIWLFYLLLTTDLRPGNLLLGWLPALVIAALVRPPERPIDWRRLPGALWAAVRYLGVLLVDLILSGIQVAGIVLRPRIAVESGIIAIPSDCESKLGTALSAHAITLTPGTVVVEIDAAGVMYTHCLEIADADKQLAAAQRLRRQLLSRIFI